MSETIEILLKGRKGAVDGYMEIMLGLWTLSGTLISYEVLNSVEAAPGQDAIFLRLQLQDAPLGHLGTSDLAPAELTSQEKAVMDARAFQEMVRKESYVILDTETTGLEDGEICQIAVIDDNGKILMYELVKPVRGIPADATRIHGLTNKDVQDARLWVDVSHDLQKLLKGKNVVIYNAVYDRKMMHKSAEAAALPRVEWKELCKFWCAMETFAVLYGEWNEYRGNYRWQKLKDAGRFFHATSEVAHDALGDCMTTLAVCEGIKRSADIEG